MRNGLLGLQGWIASRLRFQQGVEKLWQVTLLRIFGLLKARSHGA
jgi:hypothetical protein